MITYLARSQGAKDGGVNLEAIIILVLFSLLLLLLVTLLVGRRQRLKVQLKHIPALLLRNLLAVGNVGDLNRRGGRDDLFLATLNNEVPANTISLEPRNRRVKTYQIPRAIDILRICVDGWVKSALEKVFLAG